MSEPFSSSMWFNICIETPIYNKITIVEFPAVHLALGMYIWENL